MPKIDFAMGTFLFGVVLALVLLALDKAEKLKGPWLLVLLAIAALLTLPLALSPSFIANAQGVTKVFRVLAALCVVGFVYAVLAAWVSMPESQPQPSAQSAPTPLSASDMETAVAKGIAKSQRMDLKAEIHEVLGSKGGILDEGEIPGDENSPLYITVGMTVVNSGNVPTVARGWAGFLEIADKGRFEGRTVGFSRNNKTLGFKGPEGEVVRYSFEDFLTNKDANPIAPGASMPGLLMFRFEQLRQGDVTGHARLYVRFLDSQSNAYLTWYDIHGVNTDLRDFMVPGLRPEVVK